MTETALRDCDQGQDGHIRFGFERTVNAAADSVWSALRRKEEISYSMPATLLVDQPAISNPVLLLESLRGEALVRFDDLVQRRARELIERVDAQLAEDIEALDDVAPAGAACATCRNLIGRIAPHVALATGLRVAAFTEDNSGVSLVFQSLVTDRRLNLRITPDGLLSSVFCTDERMNVSVRKVGDDEADLPRELAEWLTHADNGRRRSNQPLDRCLAGMVGAIAVGGSSRNTGRVFTALLTEQQKRKSREPEP